MRLRKRGYVGPGRLRRAAGRVRDVVAHVAATVWRSMFGTAAALCAVAGVLYAVGLHRDSYGFVLIAMVVATLATFAAALALRVETDPDPYDPEVTP